MGIGARTGGGNGGNGADNMCNLPWMRNAAMCQGRKRRSVVSNMSLGFG